MASEIFESGKNNTRMICRFGIYSMLQLSLHRPPAGRDEMISDFKSPRAARWVAFFASCLILTGPHAGATEPDGHVRLRLSWVESRAPGTRVGDRSRILGLTVEAVVPLTGLVVTAEFPPDAPARVVTSSWDAKIASPSSEFSDSIRLEIGDLDPHDPRRVDLEVAPPRAVGEAPPRAESGIASFIVTARRADGREIREAAGILCGRPSRKGTHRHGAIEFSAAPARERE